MRSSSLAKVQHEAAGKGFNLLGLVDAAFAQQSAKGVTLVPGAVSACLGIITADVDTAWQRAVTAGAMSVCAPVTKPWGQRVAQVVKNWVGE